MKFSVNIYQVNLDNNFLQHQNFFFQFLSVDLFIGKCRGLKLPTIITSGLIHALIQSTVIFWLSHRFFRCRSQHRFLPLKADYYRIYISQIEDFPFVQHTQHTQIFYREIIQLTKGLEKENAFQFLIILIQANHFFL